MENCSSDGRRVAPDGRGTPDTNRTCDLPLRRGLLYPLSYRGAAPRILRLLRLDLDLHPFIAGVGAAAAQIVVAHADPASVDVALMLTPAPSCVLSPS